MDAIVSLTNGNIRTIRRIAEIFDRDVIVNARRSGTIIAATVIRTGGQILSIDELNQRINATYSTELIQIAYLVGIRDYLYSVADAVIGFAAIDQRCYCHECRPNGTN